MKLRNKRTGEIMQLSVKCENGGELKTFDLNTDKDRPITLAELNAEWEDAPEEPITYYYISDFGAVREGDVGKFVEDEIARKEIGNYFSSREEAEKAVERLQARKRLKDKGFEFIGKTYETDKRFGSIFYKVNENTYSEDIILDLDSLFGDEE